MVVVTIWAEYGQVLALHIDRLFPTNKDRKLVIHAKLTIPQKRNEENHNF